MNDITNKNRQDGPAPDRLAGKPTRNLISPRGSARWLLAIGALILLGGGLAYGGAQYIAQRREAIATTDQRLNSVPSVRVATVRPSDRVTPVTLPATTLAFADANLYARASGYIDKRLVDIGDRVKEGQLLASISRPELDHQIGQNEGTLAQLRHTLVQAQATNAQGTRSRGERGAIKHRGAGIFP